MAPGHYRSNVSNPFNQFPPSHGAHQNSHYQLQTANFHSHNIGSHPGFASSYQNGGSNIFSPGLTNGASANNYGSAAGLGGAGATGLASHEAQMRFAHGAALQQQQAQDAAGGMNRGTSSATRIREVWKHNLEQEMSMIRNLVDKYPYVSMVCTFQGWKIWIP